MLRTVKAVVVSDPYSEPVVLVCDTSSAYAGMNRKSYTARLSTGELVERNQLHTLLRALARRAQKGDL